MDLHEAIIRVLQDNQNHWMTTTEIAAEINRHGHYTRGDNEPLPASQVSARISKELYQHYFDIDRSHRYLLIRLAES